MALPMQRCCSRLRAMRFRCPAAGYHAKPLRLNLSGVFIPDPADPKTKEWHKGPAFEAKLYGRYGGVSGVRPERLWPSPEKLREMEAEEAEWCPGLSAMISNVEARDREEMLKEEERQRVIAANMAKMPKMVAEWRAAKREARLKEKAEKAKKQHLLALAREKFGINVDFRSPKFLEMLKDTEKDERRKMKAVKRLQREEERAAIAAAISTAFAAKQPVDDE